MLVKPSKIHAYMFIFPSLFLTVVFGIYPLLWALRYMFYDYQGIGTPVFIGLDNFGRILRDGQFWDSEATRVCMPWANSSLRFHCR